VAGERWSVPARDRELFDVPITFNPYQGEDRTAAIRGLADLRWDPLGSWCEARMITLIRDATDAGPIIAACCFAGSVEPKARGTISVGNTISLSYPMRINTAASPGPTNASGLNDYTVTTVETDADGELRKFVARFESPRSVGDVIFEKVEG
jgi:hypothetical protein